MTSSAETAGLPATSSPPVPLRAASRGGGRRRWEFWRSPEDQPGWARPALLAVAAFAAALYSWNIASSGYAMFYSDSVKSMSVSWKAWLFGAMDPGATITLDKIPGSFAIQALFARLFGFHQWSVTLPQVIMGVVAVLVTYRMVRRWAGPEAGLLAALVFAFTPVLASMFGHSMEDGALTFCLVLAADRFQVAVASGRLRPLLWAGFWVGAGFQMKMMQAWMVLPGFALAYLLVAPGRLRRRVWQLAVAGVVCLAVSVTWVVMMTVVPAKDRPYVDGSTNNSAIAMVFGYNGLDRFGIHISGSLSNGFTGGGNRQSGTVRGGSGTSATFPGGAQGAPGGAAGAPGAAGAGGAMPSGMPTAASGGGAGVPGGFPGAAASGAAGARGGFPGAPGARGGAGGGMDSSGTWTKLLSGRFAAQISWMLPFALMVLAFGLVRRRRAGRTDRMRAGLVTWGAWLVVVGLVFSDMSTIPHTAYMATLAPPLAALSGAGLVMLWRAYRAGGRAAWALPVVVAVQAAWTAYLWSGYGSFLPWLRWVALLGAVAGAALLAAARLSRRTRTRLATVGLVLGLATAFTGTVAWSASAFDPSYDGSAFDATAGPSSGMGGPGGGSGRAGGGGGMVAQTSWTTAERALWAYVTARQDGAEYPLATIGWRQAEPYILMTGAKVLPIGGFSGTVDEPTYSAFLQLVREGRLHYVLTGGSGGMMGGGSGGSASAISSWTTQHCTKVAASAYGGGTSSAASQGSVMGFPGGGGSGSGTLYRCGS